MMRIFLQSIERFVGPSLVGVSQVVYWIGLVALATVVLLPVWRLWLERATAKAGLEERWVARCDACGQTGPVWAGTCSACGVDLGVPWIVRWRTRGAAWLASPALRWAARLYHLLGVSLFLLVVVAVVRGTGAFTPAGPMHRLFVGLALLALAAAGRSLGRAFRLEGRGPLARAGDALQGLAAVGFLSLTLFFAAAAHPVSETRLARLEAGDGVVRVGDQVIRTNREGEIGVEYLQINHEGLGYVEIVPLAYLGAERAPLPLGRPTRWLVAHLRAHADDYERRGLTVRVRSDRRRVNAGERYEIVESRGQVLIRRL